MLHYIVPLIILIILALSFRRLLQLLSENNRSRHTLTSFRSSEPYQYGPIWAIERTTLSISIFTTALNVLPRMVITYLGVKGSALLKRLYDAGSVVGTLGGVIGIGGLVYAAISVWKSVWDEAEAHAGLSSAEVIQKVMKRAAMSDIPSITSASPASSAGLQPLVGVYCYEGKM